MKHEIILPYLLICFIFLSFGLQATERPINSVGCIIINDGFLTNKPQLLSSNPVLLSADTTQVHPIFHYGNLTITIGTASFIQTDKQLEWISSFKVMVKRTGKDTIIVRSSPRTHDTQMMNAHLTLSHDNVGSDELIIECNSH